MSLNKLAAAVVIAVLALFGAAVPPESVLAQEQSVEAQGKPDKVGKPEKPGKGQQDKARKAQPPREGFEVVAVPGEGYCDPGMEPELAPVRPPKNNLKPGQVSLLDLGGGSWGFSGPAGWIEFTCSVPEAEEPVETEPAPEPPAETEPLQR